MQKTEPKEIIKHDIDLLCERSHIMHSEVRLFRAIPDGSGDYMRDKRGNVLLGQPIITKQRR